MKKITILLLLLSTLLLSGCVNTSDDPIDQPDEPTAYEVIQEAIENTTISDTMLDVVLPSAYGNVTITWSSNITGTVSSTGQLILGTEDQLITLTGVFSYQDKILTKLYTTTLLKDPNINYDLIDVNTAIDNFTFDDLTVTEDIVLVTGEDDVAISWASDNTSCVSDSGIVYRPGEEDEDCEATLTATFSKGTETGTKTFTFTVVSLSTTVVYTGYYDGIAGLEGIALENALHNIINDGFSGVTYGEARYILDESDQDPNNPNNLILVYELRSINNSWDYGVTWNREHVWPQSLLGVSADNAWVNQASDLQNLKPADPGENSSRSNKYFDNYTSAATYEPPTESKGDIARILFYMHVMYSNLELVEGTPSTYEMGRLSILLQWNLEDPVDEFEINRNEVIYSYQGNRNPFIDHPELADLIWSN